MPSRTTACLFVLLLAPVAAHAQSETLTVKTIAESSAAMFKSPKTFILRAAEKMPEEHYGFRPTPDVRTFGEVLGHIADGYRLVCAMAVGDKMPEDIRQNEKTKKTKAELVQALTEASAYCDTAHEQLSGPKGAERIDWFGGKHPRVTVLYFNSSHAWEHYGNVVTYMRLKGLVPPSSEPRNPPPPAQ